MRQFIDREYFKSLSQENSSLGIDASDTSRFAETDKQEIVDTSKQKKQFQDLTTRTVQRQRRMRNSVSGEELFDRETGELKFVAYYPINGEIQTKFMVWDTIFQYTHKHQVPPEQIHIPGGYLERMRRDNDILNEDHNGITVLLPGGQHIPVFKSSIEDDNTIYCSC